MIDLIEFIAACLIWGIAPAGLHVLLQLMVARAAEKRSRRGRHALRKQRLREWRTRIPDTSAVQPVASHADHTCRSERLLWYLSYARDDAIAHDAQMLAHQAAHRARRSTHIQN